jgi:hypothetical protein
MPTDRNPNQHRPTRDSLVTILRDRDPVPALVKFLLAMFVVFIIASVLTGCELSPTGRFVSHTMQDTEAGQYVCFVTDSGSIDCDPVFTPANSVGVEFVRYEDGSWEWSGCERDAICNAEGE